MNRMNEEQELPQGWVWVAIGALSTSKNGIVDGPFGSNLKTSDYIDDIANGVPVLTTKNLEGDYSPEKVRFVSKSKFEELKRSQVNGGDILIAKIGSIGKNGVYPKGYPTALIPANLIKITLDNDEFFKYIYYHIKSQRFQDLIKSISKATAQPAFNVSQFRTLSIPLPPLPEQRRIVAKLEELFSKLEAGVTAVRRTQALLKRYRQSVLHAAVTGELTRAWRETHPLAPAETGAALLQRIRAERRAQWEAAQVAKRGGQLPLGEGWKAKYAEPEEPDTSELHELPEGWTWCRLDSVAEMCLGKMLDEAKNKGTLQPYLRNVSVRWGSFDLEHLKQMRFTEEEDERYSVKKGDLVICEGGEPGRAAIWESETPIKIQKALHRVRIKSKGLLNRFLFYSLRHDALGHYLSTYFTGTGIQHFTGAALARYTFPLPPLAEQAEIVAEVERRLTVLDALSQTLADALRRAERLRQSILHQAFTGRLVPQDATDEPAAALLARLREGVAGAAQAKGKAGRKTKADSQITLKL